MALDQLMRPHGALMWRIYLRIGPYDGGEIGSTDAETVRLSPGMVPPLSGRVISANDNNVEVAVAA